MSDTQTAGRFTDAAEIQRVLGDTRPPRVFSQWLVRQEKRGDFPKRVALSTRVLRYSRTEFQAWLDSKLAEAK